MENQQINTEETQNIESLYRLLNLAWITAMALTCLAWVGIHLYCPTLTSEKELDIVSMLTPLLPLCFLIAYSMTQSKMKMPPFESWHMFKSLSLAHSMVIFFTPILVVYVCFQITAKTGSAISAPIYIPLSLILMLRLKPSFDKIKGHYLKARNQTPESLPITQDKLQTPDLDDQVEQLHDSLTKYWKVALVLAALT